MTNKEKLEAVKDFLKENRIRFKENYVTPSKAKADLCIPNLRILIRIDDEDSQQFYKKIVRYYHPLFIRESESKEFVLEKAKNLLIDCMKREHNKELNRGV